MLGDSLIMSHQVDYMSSQRSFQLKLLEITKTKYEMALLHFRTPLFLLMILVQNFMLIKNHIETWVWKSTETKLFTSKVLKKNLKSHHKETRPEHHHSLAMFKNKQTTNLQNNISRITK